MTTEEKNKEITEKMDGLKEIFSPGKYWSHDYGTANDPSKVSNAETLHLIELDAGGNEKRVHYFNGSCGCNSFNDSIQCHGFALYMAYRIFGTSFSIPTNYSGETNVEVENSNGWIVHTNGNYDNVTIEPGDIIRTTNHTGIVWKLDGDIVYVAEVWGSDNYKSRIAWGRWNGTGNSSLSTTDYLKNIALYIIKSPKSVTTPEPETITVSFDLNYTPTNGETAPDPVTYPENDKPTSALPTPSRIGYRFDGWYTAEGARVSTFADIDEGTNVLYAQWVGVDK